MTELALPWAPAIKGSSNPMLPTFGETEISILETEDVGVALPDFIDAGRHEIESATSIFSPSDSLRAFDDAERWASVFSSAGRTGRRPATAQGTMQYLEVARKALGLKLDLVATIAGASPRRYQEWRKGEPIPRKRVPHLMSTASFFSRLLHVDPWAATSLFEKDAEIIGLLSQGAFADALERFTRVHEELEASFVPAAELIWAVPRSTAELAEAASSEAVQQVLRMLEAILPETRAATESWRVEMMADVTESVRSLLEDNQLSEDWSWLAGLTDAEVERFKNDSIKVLQNRHFRPDDWDQFVREAQERAEANIPSFDYEAPTPLPAIEASDQSTLADLQALGLNFGVRSAGG